MIRDGKEEDLESILDIYNDAILNTTAIYDYKVHTLSDREIWYKDKLSEGFPLIVFEEDNKVLGYASYGSFRAYPAFKYTVENSLYVHKDYRNKGIGTLLLKELIKIAEDKGFKVMVAAIDGDNTKSILMHERFGFKYSGTINKAGYKFKKWLNLVFYDLELKGPENPVGK
ncbi:MAG TPA: GNAT family N-acetyltransferase [Clostridiaceae bacterium]